MKLKLERQKEEEIMFQEVNGVGFDDRRDITFNTVK